MLSGHASHQVGLDADVWLTPMPNRTLTKREREDISARLVVKDRKTMDYTVWTEAHARLIKRAASYPEVARIFVHPPIKAELCKWATGDRSWLAKIRPYYRAQLPFPHPHQLPEGFAHLQEPAAIAPQGRRPAAARNWPTGWAMCPGCQKTAEARSQRQAAQARPALDSERPSC